MRNGKNKAGWREKYYLQQLLGWNSFGKLSIKYFKYPNSKKKPMHNIAISYGAETWNITKSNMKRLASIQRAHETENKTSW